PRLIEWNRGSQRDEAAGDLDNTPRSINHGTSRWTSTGTTRSDCPKAPGAIHRSDAGPSVVVATVRPPRDHPGRHRTMPERPLSGDGEWSRPTACGQADHVPEDRPPPRSPRLPPRAPLGDETGSVSALQPEV